MQLSFTRARRATALILLALSLITTHPELWYSPTGTPVHVNNYFDLPNGPFNAGHRGIDFPAREGSAVNSPAAGTVTFSGVVVDRPVLSIRPHSYPGTVFTLEPIKSDLKTGDVIDRAQYVGTVSSGGHCARACLHLGVRVHGEYVNPLRYFHRRPVLLPWQPFNRA